MTWFETWLLGEWIRLSPETRALAPLPIQERARDLERRWVALYDAAMSEWSRAMATFAQAFRDAGVTAREFAEAMERVRCVEDVDQWTEGDFSRV